MSKNYDLIATVNIDIASPIVDETSFDNLLIVGPLPKVAPDTAPPKVGVYASLEEVENAGWKTTTTFDVTADPVGAAARVAFSQSPRPTAVYIAPIQDASRDTPEAVTETVKRALATNGWYVLCTAGVADTQYESIAALIESTEKMFCYTELNTLSTEDHKTNVGNTYYRTMGIYGKQTSDQADGEIPEANRYMNVAFVAKWLNYPSGSETAAFKTLSAVYPSELTTTEVKALTDKNLSCFMTVGNKNITMNGKVMAGEWADIIRFRDWQKNDMQVAVVNLFVTTPKIPYTDSGIALVQNQMIASLKRGQNAGGIAEDEYDADGNTIHGFITSVPRSSDITPSEKASRKLTKCKFRARLAGAIHFAEINGSLTYEL